MQEFTAKIYLQTLHFTAWTHKIDNCYSFLSCMWNVRIIGTTSFLKLKPKTFLEHFKNTLQAPLHFIIWSKLTSATIFWLQHYNLHYVSLKALYNNIAWVYLLEKHFIQKKAEKLKFRFKNLEQNFWEFALAWQESFFRVNPWRIWIKFV